MKDRVNGSSENTAQANGHDKADKAESTKRPSSESTNGKAEEPDEAGTQAKPDTSDSKALKSPEMWSIFALFGVPLLALGIDRVHWRSLPPGDRIKVLRTAIAPWLGCVFMACAFFAGLSVAFNDDLPLLGKIAVAAMAATILLIFDLSYVSRASTREGANIAEFHGLTSSNEKQRVTKPLLFRLCQSFVSAVTVAVILLTLIFGKSISLVLDVEHREVNAPITVIWQERAAERMGVIQADIDRLLTEDARIIELLDETSAPKAPDSFDVERVRAELANAQEERSAAQERAGYHRRLEEAERQGADIEGATGNRGCYTQCLFHAAEAKRFEDRVVVLDDEIAQLKSELALLTSNFRNSAKDLADRSAAERRRLEAARADVQGQITALKKERDRLVENENEWVLQQVKADPAYTPLDDTLAGKIGALEEVLTQSWLVLLFGIALKLLITALDLAAVIQHAMGGSSRVSAATEFAESRHAEIKLFDELHDEEMESQARELDRLHRKRKLDRERFEAAFMHEAYESRQHGFDFGE